MNEQEQQKLLTEINLVVHIHIVYAFIYTHAPMQTSIHACMYMNGYMHSRRYV